MLRYQKSFVWLVAGVLCLFCAANVQAQGRRGGQDQGGPGGPGGPGGFGGPGGMGMMMGGMGRNSEATLLGMEEVQKELILDEDQLKQLAKIRDELRAQFEKMREMRDMPQEERDALMTKLREAGEKMPGQIEEILLPQQLDRLKQLVFQYQIQIQSRMGGGFGGGDLAEKLDISEDQQEKLRTKASELERQMRKEMLDKLVKELTPEQQEKYKELVGEPFEFPAQGGMGRGFGGPGGPGAPGAPGAPGGQGGRGQGGRGNRDRGN